MQNEFAGLWIKARGVGGEKMFPIGGNECELLLLFKAGPNAVLKKIKTSTNCTAGKKDKFPPEMEKFLNFQPLPLYA